MTTTSLTRRVTALAAAFMSLALILTACGGSSDNQAQAGKMREFKADNGTVEIPVKPQRIVALGSAPIYLNLGVKPVGLGPKATNNELTWLPQEAREADAKAVDVGQEVDYEKVASLKPDLIVIYEPDFVWEKGAYNENRLKSIAPTIYIELDTDRWKTQSERLADAVGERENFEADKNEYNTLTADIKKKYAKLLNSTTFMILNRWGGQFTPQSGTLSMEYPGGYCVGHLQDAGLKIVPKDAPANGDISTQISAEQLSNTVAKADVIIYPLGADGKVKPEFAQILDTNIWRSLPQVKSGRAIGIKCDPTLTYSSKVVYLESANEALGTLPGAR